MSYDLYLSAPGLTSETFVSYFADRPGFDANGWYVNELTGVYFDFSFVEAGEENDPETPDVLKGHHVEFHLNFFRPHVFGLEAEQELSAFVRAFGCSVFDPQLDGMSDDSYSPEGFLRGWNHGNKFGYQAITRDGVPDNVMFADDDLIEQVWRWNRSLPEDWTTASGEYFLPQISWAKACKDGQAIAFVVWGHGVRTAIPECATHVLLAREARKGFMGFGSRKANEMEFRLLPIEDVANLSSCAWSDEASARVLLAPFDLRLQGEVEEVFRVGFSRFDEIGTAIPSDHVLNASIANQ